MTNKKNILGIIISAFFISHSSQYNSIIQKNEFYVVSEITKVVEYSEWIDSGSKYDCNTPLPEINNVYIGTKIEQTFECSLGQIRTKSIYNVESITGDKNLVSKETEYQTLTTDEINIATGTYLAKSCNEIINSYGSIGDGIYNIYPSGSSEAAYCDMTTDNGGWTLVGRSTSNIVARESTCANTGALTNNFGWLFNKGSINNDVNAYSMGVLNKNINFNEILFGEYSNNKNWGNWVYKHSLSKTDLNGLNASVKLIGNPTPVIGGNTGFGMAHLVGETRKEHFFFRDSTVYSTYGLYENGWYSCYGNGSTKNHTTPASFGGNVNMRPGMIFVR